MPVRFCSRLSYNNAREGQRGTDIKRFFADTKSLAAQLQKGHENTAEMPLK